MNDSCSICFDKTNISTSKICIGSSIRRVTCNKFNSHMLTIICSECSKNCIKTNICGPAWQQFLFCSTSCLYVSINHRDNICHYIDWYEYNKLDEETKLALTNSQTNLIEYWNYEKNKSIVQLIINGYLINDITNMVLEYLQS